MLSVEMRNLAMDYVVSDNKDGLQHERKTTLFSYNKGSNQLHNIPHKQ